MAQGDSQILWVTVKGSERAATVTACVDNSAITFVDANGVTQPRTDSPEPVINIYKLRKANDGWTVVSRTFPDNPFCTSEGR